jgi:hypothetical protein
VLSLQAAQLSHKDLCATHLQAVDNVNDLHAGPCVRPNRKPSAEIVKVNLHHTNWCIRARMHSDILTTFLISVYSGCLPGVHATGLRSRRNFQGAVFYE